MNNDINEWKLLKIEVIVTQNAVRMKAAPNMKQAKMTEFHVITDI